MVIEAWCWLRSWPESSGNIPFSAACCQTKAARAESWEARYTRSEFPAQAIALRSGLAKFRGGDAPSRRPNRYQVLQLCERKVHGARGFLSFALTLGAGGTRKSVLVTGLRLAAFCSEGEERIKTRRDRPEPRRKPQFGEKFCSVLVGFCSRGRAGSRVQGAGNVSSARSARSHATWR